MKPENQDNHRWAVVVAGGNEGRTLLQQTTQRIRTLIRRDQTLVAISRNYGHFVESQVPHLVPSVVVEPESRGTAPAILYSLLSLCRKDPGAHVAVFPSGHYFVCDAVFMEYVQLAYEASKQRPDLVVLMGIVPNRPETVYGWIEPAECLPDVLDGSLFRVRRFWEKPAPSLARLLFARGCLWNSFVLVGSAGALLRLIREAAPDLYWRFEAARPVLGTPEEPDAVSDVYSRILSVDFSGQVLAARPDLLSVIPVRALRHAEEIRRYPRPRLQNAASAVSTSSMPRASFR